MRRARRRLSELICTGCGAAVVIATFTFRPTRLSGRRAAASHPQAA
ncbi:hypothetical protein V2I01_02770 [Micromonospora sp. BRA006-A]|nr:hypothetical protein [Micromonospora sp. BRA006-A]